MKTRIAIFLFLISATFPLRAQEIPILGLKTGTRYTLERLERIVGAPAVSEEKTLQDETGQMLTALFSVMGVSPVFFEDVTVSSKRYSGLIILRTSSGVVVGGGAFIDANSGYTPVKLVTEFINWKECLTEKYQLEETENFGPSSELYQGIGSDGNVVFLIKTRSESKISTLGYFYYNMTLAEQIQQENPVETEDVMAALLKIDIQDTFMGLTMGQKYSDSHVRRAFYNRGHYLDNDTSAGVQQLLFKDVSFGGISWDFCTVSLSLEGILFHIEMQNAYDYSESGKVKATECYDEVKQALARKYGLEDEKSTESGTEISYFGRNAMSLSLKKMVGHSKSGSTKRYVTLSYMDMKATRLLLETQKDEF